MSVEGRLRHLSAIGEILRRSESARAALPEVIDHVSRALSPNSVFVVARNDGTDETRAWFRDGLDDAKFDLAAANVRKNHAYLTGSDPFESTEQAEIRTTAVVLNSGAQSDEPPDVAQESGEKVGFVLLPLVMERAIVGLLQVQCPEPLVEADLLFLNAVVHQLAFAWEREARDAAVRVGRLLEGRYRQLVDSLDHAFVWEADVSTFALTFVSASAETLLGRTREECLSGPGFWSTHLHPDDREPVFRMLQRAQTQPGTHRCEHRSLALDGRLRWFDTSVVRVDDDPAGPRLRGISNDITPARDVHDRVRDQLDFAKSVTSGLGAALVVIGLTHRIKFFNPAAERLLGMSQKQACRKTVNDVVRVVLADGTPVAPEQDPLSESMRTARVLRNDAGFFWRHRNTVLAVSYTVAPLIRDGVVTGAVIVFQPVGELKRSEQSAVLLSEVTASLMSSLDRREILAAAGPILVPAFADFCLVDEVAADSGPLSTEPGHRTELTEQADLTDPRGPKTLSGGLSHATAWRWRYAGRPIEARVVETGVSVRLPGPRPATPEACAVDDQALDIMARLGLGSVMVVPIRARERRRGTLTFLARTSRAPYTEADLEIAEALGDRFGAALANARQHELDHAAVRTRENLLAIVSHDLRSPLAVILLTLSALAEADEVEVADTETLQKTLGVMTRAASRMNRLLDSLLDAESAENGTLTISPRSVDLRPLLEEAFQSRKLVADRSRLILRSELPPHLPAVMADADRVVQVLMNLVENAVKFTPSGGTITLGAAAVAEGVQYWVKDTGPGIPAGDLDQVFKRSWQAHSTASAGCGLGLFISKAIIEGHRGRLFAESTLGRGSTFFFLLPIAE